MFSNSEKQFWGNKDNIIIIILLLIIPVLSIYIYERVKFKKHPSKAAKVSVSTTSSTPKKAKAVRQNKITEEYLEEEYDVIPPDNQLKAVLPQTENCLVAESQVPGGGRGVYAKKDFKAGDVIEVCPYLVEKEAENIDDSVISDYVFNYVEGDSKRSIVLGLCSMYNHSDNHNVVYKQLTDPHDMVYVALMDIQKGEELFINYGDNYWDTRQKDKK